MKIDIQIREGLTQLEQMAAQLGLTPVDDFLRFPEGYGKGFCRLIRLPFQIQLHHYQYCLHQQFEVRSHNSVEDGMYILNINLSQRLLDKEIEEAQHWLSREGSTGVLYYSPGNNSAGKNEIDIPFEVVFFSIPQSTMELFLNSIQLAEVKVDSPFCHYHEIASDLEEELRSLLQTPANTNLFLQQGKALAILGEILSRFYREDWQHRTTGLTIQDVQTLLKVKGILDSQIFGTAPTIAKLAQLSNMSPSQLKSKFKALFQNSIYQYYLQQKLKTARNLLQQGQGTVAEIGYRLGYSNISQFSAQFKKRFGLSPSQIKP